MLTAFVLAMLLASLDVPNPIAADTVQAVWLAALDVATVRTGTFGRFGFVPDSLPDEADGCVGVETTGPTPEGPCRGAGEAGRDQGNVDTVGVKMAARSHGRKRKGNPQTQYH